MVTGLLTVVTQINAQLTVYWVHEVDFVDAAVISDSSMR